MLFSSQRFVRFSWVAVLMGVQTLGLGCSHLSSHKTEQRPSPFALYLEKAQTNQEQIKNLLATDENLQAIVPSDWFTSGNYLTSAEGLQRRVVSELAKLLPETKEAADFVMAQPLVGDAKYRPNYERFADILDELGKRDKVPSERSAIKRFVESISAMENSTTIENIIQERVRHWAKTSADLPRETSAYNLSDAYVLDDVIQEKLLQKLVNDPELFREFKKTNKATLIKVAKSAISATPKVELLNEETSTTL